MQPSAAMLENMRSTVPQLLDASAAQYGDKILIDFFNDDRTLSYQELAIESRKLADSLVRLGEKANARCVDDAELSGMGRRLDGVGSNWRSHDRSEPLLQTGGTQLCVE